LRPRFVTLAFVITAILGFQGLLSLGYPISSAAFSNELFQFEVLLITLAAGFFIVVSLEENRRVNSNLMRSQLATLQNAVARITSESNAKNDFIAVLAHELRNPLAPVMSGIEFLKLKNEADADDMETLDVMEDRMNTVKRLLDDLLDISRISEGKISISREKVDLETIVRHAIVSTTHLVRERHQLFVFKGSEAPLSVYGDPVRLEQIFSNLISNASRYTDSGGQINVMLSLEGSHAKFEIRDTGIGIPPESMEHIFLPFHQVEQGARAKKGLGIGLALVKNFVELHGGNVKAASRGAGKGSTFSVLLPLATE
jgi:signal transduction histidine kinase